MFWALRLHTGCTITSDSGRCSGSQTLLRGRAADSTRSVNVNLKKLLFSLPLLVEDTQLLNVSSTSETKTALDWKNIIAQNS